MVALLVNLLLLGTLTFDSHCEKCEAGSFNSFMDQTPCSLYSTCPAISGILGNSTMQTFDLNVIGQAVALNNAPGCTRNSSTLLACPYGSYKPTWGNTARLPWTSVGGCPVGQSFVAGNITVDSHCEKCEAGSFNSFMDQTPCSLYSTCPAISGILGNSTMQTFDLNVIGQAVALNNAPGYTRNSSTLLACPYGSYKPTWGNTACLPWMSVGGCPVGQSFVAGNITFDSHCEKCEAGSFNSFMDQTPCSLYSTCPAISGILGNSTMQTFD